ncbi:hypothetical protein BRADI_2g02575v3 [Brachypodium distachyon]|uniref:Knottin scorpion toxin-like domain-containing protein n=1 Tax=Brachypodium distachyon TaxID=15368 RepID=I1HBT8_BRADI|nr:hypothetical protein BRADI_2g02575v3 [Brachypodium distachyon]
MRFALALLPVTLALLMLASDANEEQCTTVTKKKFGGCLQGACEDDCHELEKRHYPALMPSVFIRGASAPSADILGENK